MTVVWTDFFNVSHKIDFSKDHMAGEIHVWFPNMSRQWTWRDSDGDWVQTGFNEACKWVYAKFRPQKGDWLRADSVRIDSACYKFKGEPLGSTLMDEVKKGFADTEAMTKNVENIVTSGVKTTEQIMEVAAKI